MQPLEVLKDVFGYSEFRGNQLEVINSILNNENALALMPTGAGKSLCYQIPAIIKDGVGVVISPLIALMQDQVNSLLQLGVKARALNSNFAYYTQQEIIAEARSGAIDLLYLAPERLCNAEFIEELNNINISLFAIDEAHCVSQWGHDFRPEYTLLNKVFEKFKNISRIALTATADKATREDIIKNLNLENANIFVSNFDRPNINYKVNLKNNANKQLLQFLSEQSGNEAGIIYCGSRNKVDKTHQLLEANNFRSLPYHAGLNSVQRQRNQEVFSNEEGVIMVATIAFGMGIDKSNVRFVLHLDLPKSLEAYYQETGRAGRDGLPAKAVMIYGLQDIILQKKMIQESNAHESIKIIELRKLNSLLGFCESINCRRKVVLNYFGDEHEGNCQNCDNCLEIQEVWEGLHEAQLALSCVYRTEQMFGVAYLIDVLRGVETERIKNFRHDTLQIFGKGKDIDIKTWNSVFRQLIANDFLSVDISGFGSLKLTESSRDVLSGNKEVYFRKDPIVTKVSKVKKLKESTFTLENDFEESLFKELKALRLKLAKEQKVPPYIIFHDRTLVEIAKVKPISVEEFSNISGVGQSKLNRYGKSFLELIRNYQNSPEGNLRTA